MNPTRTPTRWIVFAIALLLAAPAFGFPGGRGMGRDHHRGGGGPGFAKSLFPPEMVMRHAQEIGLSDAQREQITAVIQQVQSDIVPLEWEMRERGQALQALLEQPQVDEAAALVQVDRVTEIENQMKKTHLTLLIRVKNLLTDDQQQQLTALKRARREEFRERGGTRGPGGPRGGMGPGGKRGGDSF